MVTFIVFACNRCDGETAEDPRGVQALQKHAPHGMGLAPKEDEMSLEGYRLVPESEWGNLEFESGGRWRIGVSNRTGKSDSDGVHGAVVACDACVTPSTAYSLLWIWCVLQARCGLQAPHGFCDGACLLHGSRYTQTRNSCVCLF